MSDPFAPVYLLHGWAANHHVFDPLHHTMPAAIRAAWHAPDLPGHGAAAFNGHFDLAATADALAAEIHAPAHLVGWSLGGLVALYLAARHPEKVQTLCLCASFAKFQAAADYPEGLSQPALAKMLALFGQDYHKYLRQFIELQLLYVPQRRERLAEVMPQLTQYGAPVALAAALDALSEADARPLLAQIHCPVLLVYGDKDSITPPRMGTYLHRHLHHSRMEIIHQAAHAPFLSHPAEFSALLTQFWHTHP